MTTRTIASVVNFKTDDTVEVIKGWDQHRGSLQIGTRITLTTLKPNGEWIGEEENTKRTVTIPTNTQKYVRRLM